MDIKEVIESVNMEDIIDRMNAYAYSRLKTYNLKNFNGKEPIDFVGDIILKALEGTRNWDQGKVSFEDFLFGSLKSEISNFFKKINPVYIDELPDVSHLDDENLEEEKKEIIKILNEDGATDNEILLFECWMEGIVKPSEIAEFLEINIANIYNIIKRLKRRLPRVLEQIKNII